MAFFIRLFVFCVGLAALPAVADEQASPVPFQNKSANVPSDVSVLAYGAAHPECLEWTDSCRTCQRTSDGRVGCSTPGIACQPKEIECKKQSK